MTSRLADVHMHSTVSDGGYSPSQLMEKCARANLKIVSLTDHDSTAGITAAAKFAKQYEMTFIPGIELSTRIKGTNVDILGYGINIEDDNLQNVLSYHRKMRHRRMEDMLQKCQEVGLNIQLEDVERHVTGETFSRPHLAKALIEKGYVKNVQESFEKYLGQHKPCYVPKPEEFSPKEAIELIHGAGGVAVVAHPVFYDLDDEIITWVQSFHLDGIEVYHRDHDEQAIKRFLQLAKRAEVKTGRKLFKTGGSDFHHESYGRIGEQLGETKLPVDEAEFLLSHLRLN
ncbi:PHP domain-containing protein [Bacillus shivajii]|uniref:PHP domain-containing protein n=1 Tax=Bacillus shivajii TaxID=1983719 RepID=UPI001CFB98AE|nr:PHP domain-containing protein [Bacillus shivajii]UCZ51582.1 PHP domain-containing protein [Bacillus shivajii]